MRNHGPDFSATISNLVFVCSILAALSIIFSQLYSLLNEKAFWLDEWAIIENIKYRSYMDLFGVLDNFQQFPRVYLSAIKYFSETFNYNYLSLRTIPFFAQTAGILLSFVICTVIFRNVEHSKLRSSAVFLLFLSYPTSLVYYSQLKQYSMEILLGVAAIWQFIKLNSLYDKKQPIGIFIVINLIFLIGPFLSYTYPISAAPIMLFLFTTIVVNYRSHGLSNKYIIPLLTFVIACCLAYYIDIRHVLADSYMENYWSSYFFHFDGIHSFINSLNNIFLFLSIHMPAYILNYNYYTGLLIIVLKEALAILAVVGIVSSFRQIWSNDLYKGSKIIKILTFGEHTTVKAYFAVTLIITLLLYFGKMLPLGLHRLNCFAIIMLSYYIIEGLNFLLTHRARFAACVGYALAPLLFINIFVPIIYWNIHVIKMDRFGDQEQYNNYTEAIKTSYKEDHPIVVLGDYKGDQLVKVNPHYLKEKPIKVYTAKNIAEIETILSDYSINRIIVLREHTHQVIGGGTGE